MVRSIFLISACLAIFSFVSAAPHGRLVGVDAGYIGTGDITIEDVLNDFLSIDDLHIEDVAQDIDIL